MVEPFISSSRRSFGREQWVKGSFFDINFLLACFAARKESSGEPGNVLQYFPPWWCQRTERPVALAGPTVSGETLIRSPS